MYLYMKFDIAENEDIALGLCSRLDQSELVDIRPKLSFDLVLDHGGGGVVVLVPGTLTRPEPGHGGG